MNSSEHACFTMTCRQPDFRTSLVACDFCSDI